MNAETKFYSPLEERINILSHAVGLLISMVATVLLVTRASSYGNAWHIVSVAIFGASLIALYAASTTYHSATRADLRARLRVIDHATIYILIAGTYTPFSLITLNGAVGWTIFAFSWGMAIIGIILKLFFTGRFNLVSTLMYVFMGWIIILAVKPLIANLSPEGLFWLVAGGMSYTIGAIIYSIKKVPLNHAIFHLFVLGGSICHFVAVYFYVLPAPGTLH
jgi:hemolysin III